MECFLCRTDVSESNMISIDNHMVCSECKEHYIQRKREGVSDYNEMQEILDDHEQLTAKEKGIVLFFVVLYLLFWVVIIGLAIGQA